MFILIWTNLILIFSNVLDLALFSSITLPLIGLGIVLFGWNIFNYGDWVFEYFINKDFKDIENSNYMEKKIRFFHQLMEDAQKDSVKELLLASVIQLHIENCTDIYCICKNRLKAYDSKLHKKSDLDLAPFKDFVFIKNLLVYLIYQVEHVIITNPNSNLTTILYLFEELANYGLINREINLFIMRFSGVRNMPYLYLLIRLKRKLKTELKLNNSKLALTRNTFEKVHIYDIELNNLKLPN